MALIRKSGTSAAPASGTPLNTFSTVDNFLARGVNHGTPPTNGGTNANMGARFFLTRAPEKIQVIGIRTYWGSALGETLRLTLWDVRTTTVSPARSVDVVTAGADIYEGIFASPFIVPFNRDMEELTAACYGVIGGRSTYISSNVIDPGLPARPFLANRLMWVTLNICNNGGPAYPNTDNGSDLSMVEPLLALV